MEANNTNSRFLITYIEKEEFIKTMEEGANNSDYQIQPEIFQYVKCIAPDQNSILPMIERRFSDVEIIGIAEEKDFVKSLNTLENCSDNDKAYVVNIVSDDGVPQWEITIDPSLYSPENIVSEIVIVEYKKILSEKLAYFSDPSIPTLSHTD